MRRPARRGSATPLRWGAWLLLALTILSAAAVVSMALSFQASRPQPWIALWIGTVAGALAVAVRSGPLPGLALVLAATGVVALWWMTILPLNDRNWQSDVAELLTGELDTNRMM